MEVLEHFCTENYAGKHDRVQNFSCLTLKHFPLKYVLKDIYNILALKDLIWLKIFSKIFFETFCPKIYI